MNRRGFIAGLISVFAAPAIVRIDSIMPVSSRLIIPTNNSHLAIQLITRETIKLFKDSNLFLQNLQYDDQFKVNIHG